MKTSFQIIVSALFALGFISASAQPGAHGPIGVGARGASLSGVMAKLFGENSSFSATMEMQTRSGSPEEAMSMPGKISYTDRKSRFDMDLTQAKGAQIPPGTGAQMKSMGMDKMISISRPDKKLTYMIYPGLQAYTETAIQNPEAAKPGSDFKIETSELGKETVDGHPCVKNKSIVTDKEGKKHEATTWNATDLKNFPIKIEQAENGTTSTWIFKDIKLAKPDSSLFDPPADFTKYASMQELMQQVMLQRFGAGQGLPPGTPHGEPPQ